MSIPLKKSPVEPVAGEKREAAFNFEMKAADDERKTIRFIASTDSVDRMDDRILQDGWKLDRFKSNPVILYGHQYRELPVGKAEYVGVEDNKLVVEVAFAEYDFAQTVYELVKGGFLNAVSVGFIPLSWKRVEDKETGRSGYDIEASELLEISIVTVPANQDALVQARSKGIDLGPLEKVIETGMTTLKRSDEALETILIPKGGRITLHYGPEDEQADENQPEHSGWGRSMKVLKAHAVARNAQSKYAALRR